MIIPLEINWKIKDCDIQTFTKKASGAGGQHVNTTDSCVVMRHLPTGLEVKASSRCQHQNKKLARASLEAKVSNFYQSSQDQKIEAERLSKCGSGMRGDKIKTYRVQDGIVTNHLINKKFRLKDVLNGKIS